MATQYSVERVCSSMELLQSREMSGSFRYCSTQVSSPTSADGEEHHI